MNTKNVGITDCLQSNECKQEVGAAVGEYWFEITEIDEQNESHQEFQSSKIGDDNTYVCEENSSATNSVGCAWADLSWTCVTCLQVFNSAFELTGHNMAMHNKKVSDMEWFCTDCKSTFRNYCAQINHIRRTHHNHLELICDVCDKKCASFKELDDHRRDHKYGRTSINIQHCVTCGLCFKSTYYLQKHIELYCGQKTNEARFHCSVCNKSFQSRFSLAYHQLVHGTLEFTCKECGKIFNKKYNLERHKCIHSKPRQFQCTKCSKFFSSKLNLESHKKNCIHSKCDGCHLPFRHKTTLAKHRAQCSLALLSDVDTKNFNMDDLSNEESDNKKNIDDKSLALGKRVLSHFVYFRTRQKRTSPILPENLT